MRTAILFLTAIACFGQTRVNVGGPQYTDAAGNIWAADTGCSSATTYTYAGAIRGTVDPIIYQTGRTDPSSLSCSYQVSTNTFYLVTLKFAEYNPSMTTGKRLMNVFINGAKYYTALDIFSMCGFAAACDQSPNPIPVSNTGVISVVVTQQQGQPMLAGIQITAIAGGGIPLPASSPLTYLRVKPSVGNLQTLEFASILPVNIADYNFTPLPFTNPLSAGTVTLNLAICPLGVVGGTTHSSYYISGGSGTAEAVLTSGGSCAGDGISSGTLIVSIANSHAGTWFLSSASGGMQEAANVNPGASLIGVGAITINGQVRFAGMAGFSGYSTAGTLITSNVAGAAIQVDSNPTPFVFSNFTLTSPSTGTGLSIVTGDVIVDRVRLHGGDVGIRLGIAGQTATIINSEIDYLTQGVSSPTGGLDIGQVTIDNTTFLSTNGSPGASSAAVFLSQYSLTIDNIVVHGTEFYGVSASGGGSTSITNSTLLGYSTAGALLTNVTASFVNNNTFDQGVTAVSLVSPSATFIHDNYGIDDIFTTVASGTSISAPISPYSDNLDITGTTTTTTITNGLAGRTVTLIRSNSGSVTIGGGGNIPGAHTLAQGGKVVLKWNGSAWY